MLIVAEPEKLPLRVTIYTVAMVPLGLIFPIAGMTNWTFPVVALAPSLWFLKSVVEFSREFKTNPHAMSSSVKGKAVKAFMASVYFLMIYFILLVLFRLEVDEKLVKFVFGEDVLKMYKRYFAVEK